MWTNTTSSVAPVKFRNERQIVQALRGSHASSLETAKIIEVHRPLGHASLRSLISSGAVKETPAMTYFLDEECYGRMRRSRHILLGILLFIAFDIAVAAFVYATFSQS
jgi:hypothetical protein